MIIDCISDLHGYYPELQGGDLLIVAGDLTASDEFCQYTDFFRWLLPQKYTRKILVAGNHDGMLRGLYRIDGEETDLSYLCDSGTEFTYYIEGFPQEDEKFLPSRKRTLKIWGSPWTRTFPGMNPRCMAFTVATEEELAEKWKLIPEDIDILVTHGPMYGMFDKTKKDEHVGSGALSNWVLDHYDSLKLHVCGHIHEGYGVNDLREFKETPVFVNCSHVNAKYEPVNMPVRIIL